MNKIEILMFLGIIPVILCSIILHEYTHFYLAGCNGGISDFFERFTWGSIFPGSKCTSYLSVACTNIAGCENIKRGSNEFYPTIMSFLSVFLYYGVIFKIR